MIVVAYVAKNMASTQNPQAHRTLEDILASKYIHGAWSCLLFAQIVLNQTTCRYLQDSTDWI